MSIYQIYKYTLSAAAERSLIAQGDGRSTLDRAQEILEGILGSADLRAQKTVKDGSCVLLDLSTECHRDGITIMVLCNVKNKSYMEKLEKHEFEYHPGCRIIIDNRPGHGIMAIERSSSFEGKPDKVRDTLTETLNALLADYNLEISIRPQAREDELWNIVEDKVLNRGDAVSSVNFSFPNPGRQKPVVGSRRIRAMLGITTSLNARKAFLRLEADPGQALRFEKAVNDCSQMAALCLQNGYDLIVHFKKSGVLRYGGETAQDGTPTKAEVRVLAEFSDDELLGFRTGQRTMLLSDRTYDYELTVRLDAIMNTVKTSKDARPAKKNRKKGSKRKAG